MGRPTKHAARQRKIRLRETKSARSTRLQKVRKQQELVRKNEVSAERTQRLDALKEYRTHRLRIEKEDDKSCRLQHQKEFDQKRLQNETSEQRLRRLRIVHERLHNESPEQHSRRLRMIATKLEQETLEARIHRMSLIKARIDQETPNQRSIRLERSRIRASKVIENETEPVKRQRLEEKRLRNKESRKGFSENNFREAVNIFSDVPCTVCRKALYPQQRYTLQTHTFSAVLPAELRTESQITACSRCCNAIKKGKSPSQAYWNNLQVTPIPEELSVLSEVEKRLLSRVVPFQKIIKVANRFSQAWCKGQVILFAQDVEELAEQLPLQLIDAGLYILTESLDNVQRAREFSIDLHRLKRALQWLLANNSLYKDVKSCFPKQIDIDSIVRLVENDEEGTILNSDQPAEMQRNMYKDLNENTKILRGSFNQANEIFSFESRGRQCTGNAAMACIAFCSSNPNTWSISDIDNVLVSGDRYFRESIAARQDPHMQEANREYLTLSELLSQVRFGGQDFNFEPLYPDAFNGHLLNDNPEFGFLNLNNALIAFARDYTFGVLTLNSTTVAIHISRDNDGVSFWLFDSHSRGPKGYKATSRGVACCMCFKNLSDLHDVVRRNLQLVSYEVNLTVNVFALTPISITPLHATDQHMENIMTDGRYLSSNKYQSNPREENEPKQKNTHIKKVSADNDIQPKTVDVILSTSMLREVDENIPNVENVLNVAEQNEVSKLIDIKRKTAPPLSLEKEKRMEELGWYYLFPNGKNGFGEQRRISITPLDYFQSRILNIDRRFERPDYLFFALSIVEYYRVKSSVSVSCRMLQGDQRPQGLVDNIHLTMRNVRGSASYWRRCCAELLAMVRNLGPPSWFVTFSCNDLNWPDMIKALLIADNKNPDDFEKVPFAERLRLVERYPVVIARQFTVRVNALLKFIKHNADCLRGQVEDYWYRIEFQNRGSPHLHMLLWCTGLPDFASVEGVQLLDEVVTCALHPEDQELAQIVRNVQLHRHTSTCYKDRNTGTCRFGFPRQAREETVCLDPDTALRNNGRFCHLRRDHSETMVNNYNPTLLRVWEANMDIQPCGNVTAVAYYVAKYASKCEPHDVGDVVRQAVSEAKRRGGPLQKQLFLVSMAVLSQRLVSAPECAYRLCHLPLKMSSRKAVFVNSCKPEDRFRILRFETDATSTFNNIFDRYVLRPDSLEELSLAEFAVRYETVSNPNWTEEDGDPELVDSDAEGRTKFVVLQDNTRMKERTKPAVLRTRYFTMNSDREGYFYNMVVCHIPFRDEKSLLLPDETAEACFLRRHRQLKPLLKDMTTENFAHAEQMIQQALASAIALQATSCILEREETANLLELITVDEDVFEGPVENFENERVENHMPNELFLDSVRSLNVQQKQLFAKVSTAVEKDIGHESEQLLLFVTGGAGSGKTFLLKLIVEHIKRCYAPTVDVLLNPAFVEVAALTGVAARQVLGRTLHSVFSLPIEKGSTMTYKKMTGQRLEQERRKWRYINWLIIDEISMVSYENLRIIHLRLQEFKSSNTLFGGVNILLFGDIMQLPPVKGHWCFDQPPWCSAEINLWHQFSFCELTVNMRQRTDTEFIDLLNNLRFGELTADQLELLCERKRQPLDGDFTDGAAVRIFPTLKLVDEYNTNMTLSISKAYQCYTINAVDESREVATYGKKPPDNVIPSDPNNCGGLLHSIILAEGSRVMLRRNISLSDGLVNGAMGIVKRFKWPALRRDQLETGELPEAVLIWFDDETIGTRFKDTDGLVSIAPVCSTYQATRGYGDVERRMLPLILSWAVTVHKLQGTTLERAVIDLGKKVFAKGQAYVALSRVRSLDGLVLCDLEPNKLLRNPHDSKAFNEMLRMRRL